MKDIIFNNIMSKSAITTLWFEDYWYLWNILIIFINLIDRDKRENKLFDVLQKKSSRNEYEIILKWLICFYLRSLKMKVELNFDSELNSNSEDSAQL